MHNLEILSIGALHNLPCHKCPVIGAAVHVHSIVWDTDHDIDHVNYTIGWHAMARVDLQVYDVAWYANLADIIAHVSAVSQISTLHKHTVLIA